jgi:hypothetical protein
MPDSDMMLRERFHQLAGTHLPVPDASGVISRGTRRRRRARSAAASGLAVMAIAAVTAAQLAGPAGRRQPPGSSGTARPSPRASLPASGHGPLALGFTSAGYLVSARIGSSAAPTRAKFCSERSEERQVATNPVAGWVVACPADRADQLGRQAAQMVLITRDRFIFFGPRFSRDEFITGLAVRPDGSAVAVGVTRLGKPQVPARIELVPLPGSAGRVRSWHLSQRAVTGIESLSWQNDRLLTYIPGSDKTGGGFAGDGVVTLNTAAPGRTAPAESAWPPFTKRPGQCSISGGTWLRHRYLALEACDRSEILAYVNAATGQRRGSPIPISGYGCPDAALNPSPSSAEVLVPWCGLQLYRHGHVSQIRGHLVNAAFGGP